MTIRINIIPKGTLGEGDFFWLDDTEQVKLWKYSIDKKTWATIAFECIPCDFLPSKYPGKWIPKIEMRPNCYYETEDGSAIAYMELLDEQGAPTVRWEKDKNTDITILAFGRKRVFHKEDLAFAIGDLVRELVWRRVYRYSV